MSANTPPFTRKQPSILDPNTHYPQEGKKEETNSKNSHNSFPVSNASNEFEGLECLVELRNDDKATGIQFRDCQVDYTHCPNNLCIKKLF